MRTTTVTLLALAIASPAISQDQNDEKGIVQFVAESPEFQTLYSCIQASGLAETFEEGGPFTIFAPSDEAFAKLPRETVDGLLEDKEALARILKYHILPAKVSAADAKEADGSEVKTLLEGCPLRISVQDDTVMAGTARVTKTDVSASDGVIHVIDTVLMPPPER